MSAFLGAVLVMVGIVPLGGAVSDWRHGSRGAPLVLRMALGLGLMAGGLALVWMRLF